MRRRAVWRGFTAITIATVALGTVAVALALRQPSAAQEREVRAADERARSYARRLDAALVTFAEQSRHDVNQHAEDLAKALALVRRHVTEVPEVSADGTTSYGRAHSLEYRAAEGRRGLALRPFVQLVRVLEEAVDVQAFIRAGTDVIGINPLELLAGTPVVTGEPLRDRVVPAYESARKRLKRQDVPPGSAVLGRDLQTYVSDAITMTKDGADAIDAGRPFRFDFGTRPQDLQRRLAELNASVVASALQAVDETAGFGTP
ncbi:hypothetical protein ASD11_03745 [Aeromicrobium sp. Root495]|uniref:hypothetical protein n=1 Tax=Aeromicrobium sp. Root495 TaxID=1736550 RepID=UPI0006FC4728|nr:hypothetical protein [Aeromicrobium sp. Root495]KQY58760.1 hypothetical protein ASD11_03745 [Aeromicrobium sp. Root495]